MKLPAQAAFCTLVMLGLGLTACTKPPYNNFTHPKRTLPYTAIGAGAGTAIGAIAGSTGAGAIAGGAIGLARGAYLDSQRGIKHQLQQSSIQVIDEGSRVTVIVPTDKYYLINRPVINELRYEALNNLAKLLLNLPPGQIYVAGFTDNIGSKKHKERYSDHLAQAMLTFLWAKNIDAKRLNATGYADKLSIANNRLIHGSAMNRRVEIQWRAGTLPKEHSGPKFRT